MSFTILTYNIHSGSDAQIKYNFEAIIDVLSALRADVIGINEIDRYWGSRSNWQDQVKILSNRLNMESYYAPAMALSPKDGRREKREYGNALFTRFPIIEKVKHIWYMHDDPKIIYDGTCDTESRSLLQARLNLGGSELWVLVTHLTVYDQKDRLNQVKKLAKIIKNLEGALILMGDLNATVDSEELSILTKYLNNPSEGKRFVTYYPENPRQIDFILTRDINCRKIEVVKSNASDHYPLCAQLSL